MRCHPGVDPERWAPAPPGGESAELLGLRQRFGGQRVFLYMGRIATEKNVEALLRAWRLVQPKGCTLVVVGDGPVRQSLMQSYGPESNVHWWGHEPDQAKRVALLQLAEVFLLPSLVEGLSLALLEAMASGTACVATDAGADGEVLEGGAGIVISTQGVTTQLRTLLPVLPGLALLPLGALLWVWAVGWAAGWPVLALALVILLLGWGADALGLVLGAARMQATRWAYIGSGLGLVAGLFGLLPALPVQGVNDDHTTTRHEPLRLMVVAAALPDTIDRIVAAIGARPGASMVEIGPGHGAITEGLLAAAGVLTIVPGAIVIWFVRHYIAKGFAMGRV